VWVAKCISCPQKLREVQQNKGLIRRRFALVIVQPQTLAVNPHFQDISRVEVARVVAAAKAPVGVSCRSRLNLRISRMQSERRRQSFRLIDMLSCRFQSLIDLPSEWSGVCGEARSVSELVCESRGACMGRSIG
jgi:hypothetical protein